MSAQRDPFAELGEPPENPNVALELRRWARLTPDAPAVRVLGGKGLGSMTYAELDAESDALARAMEARGVRAGDRTCVFVRAGIELIATTYALFKLGAVPVLIDPGMGRKRLLECVEKIRPRALVGIPAAHVVRRLFRRYFKTVEASFVVHRAGTLPRSGEPIEPRPVALDDEAAILFTSGSTGPAKGVVYRHLTFWAQMRALSELYRFRPGEVDVACFPLFALFDTALGMTSVFPELDPSRPGRCRPEAIARAIEETGATLTFGSPAIWRRVVPWLIREGRTLPTLERVLIAGAPVPPSLVEGFQRVLPEHGDVHTPYGATEALPVATISGAEILALREETERGAGTCVGHVAPGIDCRIVGITDDPLPRWSDELELPQGEVGEVVVRGPAVTQAYKFEPLHQRHSKIPNGDHLWHRMGDLGRLDGAGRLWFAGRKSHRLETERGVVPAVPQENIFNTHPAVQRSALVGVGERGAEEPVLIVEPAPPAKGRPRRELAAEIAGHREELEGRVAPTRVLFKKDFPVDVRHNAKIHRGDLREWAAGKLR